MPACQPPSNSVRPGGRSPSAMRRFRTAASASSRMRPSISRRSRFSRSSSPASVSASPGIIRQQAADADRHVVDPPGRIEARRDLVAELARRQLVQAATRDARERHEAGRCRARAHAAQAFLDEDAVVAVERHHVGDRAERHEVEEIRDRRQALVAALLQLAGQRRHEVERDADARQRPAAELRAGQVRVHVRRAVRQGLAAGRWWSVTSTSMPRARAASMPAKADTPLSTVTIRSARSSSSSATSAGVRP